MNEKQKSRRPPDWWMKQYGLCSEVAAFLAAAWERCVDDWNDYSYGCLIGAIIMCWCCRQIDTQQKAELVQEASHFAWRAREELV